MAHIVAGRNPALVEVGSLFNIIYKVLCIAGGAGFLPSTVSPISLPKKVVLARLCSLKTPSVFGFKED